MDRGRAVFKLRERETDFVSGPGILCPENQYPSGT